MMIIMKRQLKAEELSFYIKNKYNMDIMIY